MIEINITSQEAGQRSDKFLLKYLDKATKSFIYKMLRKKNIKLNGQKMEGHELLVRDDKITIYFTDETIQAFKTNYQPKLTKFPALNVIFEDDQLLVINKPVNLLSQPKDDCEPSLVDWIEQYLFDKGEYIPGGGFRVGICNRLDKNTTGVVIACKSIQSFQVVNKAIHDKNIQKKYHAIVLGEIIQEVYLQDFIQKDSSLNKVSISSKGEQEIISIVKPLRVGKGVTLCEVTILTGKTHQIRVHLSSIGHPIIGDYKYGYKSTDLALREQLEFQCLHCYAYQLSGLTVPYDSYNAHAFIAPYNDIMQRLIKELF